jgi:hypothetical protein
MGKHRLAFIAFDSAKEKHAVAIADEVSAGWQSKPSIIRRSRSYSKIMLR